MVLKQGGFRIGVDREYERKFYLSDGQVATDSVILSAVASFGTTAVEVYSKMIDPGYTVKLDELEFNVMTRLQNRVTSAVGSFTGYFGIQPVYNTTEGTYVLYKKTGDKINVSGTFYSSQGSYSAGSYTDFALTGFVPVGSVPYAPFKLTLNMLNNIAGATAQIKSIPGTYSFVRLMGSVIPGT